VATDPDAPIAIEADAVVLDIEGTTTPIDFVHTTLFGFVRERLAGFLAGRSGEPAVAAALASLADEHAAEADPTRPADAGEAWIRWLMDRDRKSTGLKALQGLIWQGGYRAGELRSAIYDDVAPALERWHRAGLTIGIYSSGSIEAQRLLFAHSERGDLTGWIDRYFDTTTGPKREADSYRRIAAALGLPPARIVFVSDVGAELDASRAAGLEAVLSIRPGNAPAAGAPAITSFAQLTLTR
jgi:enolase-phosphatase E1